MQKKEAAYAASVYLNLNIPSSKGERITARV